MACVFIDRLHSSSKVFSCLMHMHPAYRTRATSSETTDVSPHAMMVKVEPGKRGIPRGGTSRSAFSRGKMQMSGRPTVFCWGPAASRRAAGHVLAAGMQIAHAMPPNAGLQSRLGTKLCDWELNTIMRKRPRPNVEPTGPSPDEIAARAEYIRSSWSPRQLRTRAGLPPDENSVEIMLVSPGALDGRRAAPVELA